MSSRFPTRKPTPILFSALQTIGIKWTSFAKKERGKWYNDLDMKVRMSKRNETNGIAIGPATSNILPEIILARVDQEIASSDFIFARFSDDYVAYCDTEQGSHDFIMKLSRELDRYGLKLGAKKQKSLRSRDLHHQNGLRNCNHYCRADAESLHVAPLSTWDWPSVFPKNILIRVS